ncbi:MAG TPA: CoA transferase [Pelomicrobium sp.]|nr:CoA transferase [Pelomicrobium sp.]
MTDKPYGPLAGVKVLELAQIMAGPTTGMLLADMGADVIKVEKIPGGDDTRSYSEPTVNGEAAPFMVMNRNKRSIAVNLKKPGGVEVVKRLAAGADVLTENYRKGTMEKLGLGYDTLKTINPALIYCSISGYGRTGPYADKGGFDLIAQGVSGLMSITGRPGEEPIKTGSPIADINAGILAALGIVSAYVHRLKTGEGQLVDTSLMEAGIQQTYWHAAIYFATGVSPQPTGSAHLLTAPYQAFPTRDGWINVGGANQSNWERIARLAGGEQLVDDPRFRTNADRMRNRAELADLLGALFRKRTTREWMAELDAAGVPAGPVNTIADMVNDPQTKAREMVVDLQHPRAGATRAIGLPIKFSATPGRVSRPAPLYGQHTREVLREHGYGDGEIDALHRDGAVTCGDHG